MTTGREQPDLDALLLQYLPRLRAFVRVHTNATVRKHESCSDLVQSVCREVLAGADAFRYEGDAPFRSWLFRTALNKILERTRHLTAQKRDVRKKTTESAIDYGSLPGVDPTASQLAAASELSDRMQRAFDQLTDDHRHVIALSRIVGLGHTEIATAMGRSEGAVRVLLSRALVAFTGALDAARGPDAVS